MGLDIFLSHFKRPEELLPGDTVLEGVFYVVPNKFQDELHMLDDKLLKLAVPVQLKRRILLLDKISAIFREKFPEHKDEYDDTGLFLMRASARINEDGLEEFTLVDQFDNKIIESDSDKITTYEIIPGYALDELDEPAYQRGISAVGWGMLPNNETYCSDKAHVQKMVDEGGLDEDFIKHWVENDDEQTALLAWW